MIRVAIHQMGDDPVFEKTAAEALHRFGPRQQSLACAGELAELAANLIPYGQGRKVSVFAIQEEIADALITLEQMARAHFDSPEALAEMIILKLGKLRNHLDAFDPQIVPKEARR